MSTAAPVYIQSRGKPVAALLDAPAEPSHPVSVLICAPWGWDEVASYRSRREWAERLAAAGHHVLRFDLPGVGDSAGDPREPDQLAAWVAATRDAARWLHENTSTAEVAALGLGLGGLIARTAIARGAPIEQLALWGSPARGRSFVREVRAFSGMQRWANDADAADGGIEAGGFLLSGETLDSLSGSPAPPPGRRLGRVLLLARDGVAVDEKTRATFEAADAEVREAEGDGWAVFVEHPERSVLSEGVVATVESWLAAGSTEAASEIGGRVFEIDGVKVGAAGEVEERPWFLERDFGYLFGVLVEPTKGARPGRCVVFLNAGAVRHTGPDRLWVELSRRAAALGLPSLRIDLEGIGESDGERIGRAGVAEFYAPRYERQLGAVLNSLDSRGIGGNFMLVGLCAGGYLAYRAARTDRRVEQALLLNGGALAWDEDLVEAREARKLRRAFSARWWLLLLSGRISPARVVTVVRTWLRGLGRSAAVRSEVGFDDEFDGLRRDGTQVTLAFSGDESLAAELAEAEVPERIGRWPNVRLEKLPGQDHTLRSLAAQSAAAELAVAELERFAEGSERASD